MKPYQHRRSPRGAVMGKSLGPVTYPALPTPTLLENFESTASWTTSGSTTLSLDTSRKVQGTNGLKMKATSSVATYYITKSNIGTYSPKDMGVIAYYVDFDTPPAWQDLTSLDVRLGQGGSYYTQSGVTGYYGLSETTWGGYWKSFNVSEVATLNGLGSGTTGVRITTSHAAPYAETPVIDCLMSNCGGQPQVILYFDDARPDQITKFAPIMRANGLRGVTALPTALVGAVDRLTVSDVQTLENTYDWESCPNLTSDDAPVTSYASVAAIIADYQASKAWMDSNGIIGAGRNHTVYSNGTRLVVGTEVQATTVVGNGTTTVTMASTTGIQAGWQMTGNRSYVQEDTFVVSVDSAVQVTVNKTVAVGITVAKFTDVSGYLYNNKLQTAMVTEGIKSARGVDGGVQYTRYGPGIGRALNMPGCSGSNALATDLLAFADQAILRGSAVMFYFHTMNDVIQSELDIATGEFSKFCVGLYARRRLLQNVVPSEWEASWQALPF